MKKGVQFTLTKIINRQIQNELSFTFQLLASGQFTLSLDDLGTTQPGWGQFFSLNIVWVSSLNYTILDHKLAPSPAKVRNVWAQQIWIRGTFSCFMDSAHVLVLLLKSTVTLIIILFTVFMVMRKDPLGRLQKQHDAAKKNIVAGRLQESQYCVAV